MYLIPGNITHNPKLSLVLTRPDTQRGETYREMKWFSRECNGCSSNQSAFVSRNWHFRLGVTILCCRVLYIPRLIIYSSTLVGSYFSFLFFQEIGECFFGSDQKYHFPIQKFYKNDNSMYSNLCVKKPFEFPALLFYLVMLRAGG